MLTLWLLGCAPAVFRVPGPLAGLGQDPSAEWAPPERKPPPTHRPPSPAPREEPGAAIAAAAAGFVGDRTLVVDGQRYRFDCSGLVEASLASANCPLHGSSADLFAKARDLHVLHRHRNPSPGDIAFFDDTYDRDGDGRRNDPLSHVAIVESVEKDGTITLVHLGSGGVARFVMNLRHPEDRADASGAVINDNLRVPRKGDPPRTRYLAGELWVAFASFAEARIEGDDQVGTADRSTR